MNEPWRDDLDRCLRLGLVDVWSWNCGRRPLVTSEEQIAAMIASRFKYAGIPDHRTVTANNR